MLLLMVLWVVSVVSVSTMIKKRKKFSWDKKMSFVYLISSWFYLANAAIVILALTWISPLGWAVLVNILAVACLHIPYHISRKNEWPKRPYTGERI